MHRVRYLFCALLAGLALSACSGQPKGQSKLGIPPPLPAAALAPPVAPAPVILAPEGAAWTKSGVTKTRRRADQDNCYAYAQGQIAHDVRIEGDRSSGYDTSVGGLGLIELRARMNAYERNRRRPALVRECMEAKGYAK